MAEVNRLTREQAAIVGAFTGILCGPVTDWHQYVEKVVGHAVFSHELGSPAMERKIREASRKDFLKICAIGDVSEVIEWPK